MLVAPKGCVRRLQTVRESLRGIKMSKSQQNGSSLVEVMVALFVLAIGLLGVLAMQSKSMQYNQSAHIYAQSIYLANDLAERVRANPQLAASYVATIPATEPADCVKKDFMEVGCSDDAISKWDLFKWNERVEKVLPAGKAEITKVTHESRDYLNIVVSFDDSRVEGREPDDETGYTGRKEYSLLVEY